MTLSGGFEPSEALPLMAICYAINHNDTGVKPTKSSAQVTGLKPPPEPSSFGWELAHDPGKAVFADNYWQLWRNAKVSGQYALAFRGTTTNMSSMLEDAAAIMVPAEIKILGHTIKLGEHPKARVHGGFAAGLAAMLIDNLFHVLEDFVEAHDLEDLFVVGHSQGASLATLCHSFLHYQSINQSFKPKVTLKSYVFGQARPGNEHYAYDYELISSYKDKMYAPMGFRIVSDQDWVPQVPFCFQVPKNVNEPNPFSVPNFINSKVSKILHEVEKLRLELDFCSAGIPIILRAVPGSNPNDADDFYWQHHAEHYFIYLKEQYAEIT
jgi:hypothetical protein